MKKFLIAFLLLIAPISVSAVVPQSNQQLIGPDYLGVVMSSSTLGRLFASSSPTVLSITSTSTTATSTFGYSINLLNGCFAVHGACLTSGAGTVTSVNASGGTTGLNFSGGPITNSGTLNLSGILNIVNGGTGTSTAPGFGQVLVGNGLGGYDLKATSTLGIIGGVSSVFGRTGTITAQSGDYSTLQVTENTNLYYTDARVGTYISGSSTVPHVAGSTAQPILFWNGTTWISAATSTLGIAGGSGTPGGSDTQVQYNSAGTFAGMAIDYNDNGSERFLKNEDASGSNNGEALIIQGSNGGPSGGLGGEFLFEGGNGIASGNDGSGFRLQGGTDGDGYGTGGQILMTGSTPGDTNSAGDIVITGGNAEGNNVNGGTLFLAGGTPDGSGVAGTINIAPVTHMVFPNPSGNTLDIYNDGDPHIENSTGNTLWINQNTGRTDISSALSIEHSGDVTVEAGDLHVDNPHKIFADYVGGQTSGGGGMALQDDAGNTEILLDAGTVQVGTYSAPFFPTVGPGIMHIDGMNQAFGGTIDLDNLSSVDVSGVLNIANGGTGTDTVPTLGKVLVGNASGNFDYVSTSTFITGLVPTSRTITTNSPLTGGGDLSANRTISLGLVPLSLGGTGTTTAPTLGQVLIGNSGGTYDLAATSSFGLNLTQVNSFINSSSTIPKTYTANTFSQTQTVSALTVTGAFVGGVASQSTFTCPAYGPADPCYSIGGNTNTGYGGYGSNVLYIATAGVERMRLDGSGNVAWGTTTLSGATFTTVGSFMEVGTSSSNGDIRTKSADAKSDFSFQSIQGTINNAAIRDNIQGRSVIRLNSPNDSELTLANNGLTAINNSAPKAGLSIQSAFGGAFSQFMEPLFNTAALQSYPLVLINANTTNGSTTATCYMVNTYNDNCGAATMFKRTNTNSMGEFSIWTKQSTTSGGPLSQVAVFTDSGKVGIGTTTPWRTLSVVGTMAVNGLSSATSKDAVCIDTVTKEFVDAGNTTCLASSQYVKHDVRAVTDSQADEVLKMQPIQYAENEDNSLHYGFIAEDVAKIDPKLAEYAKVDTAIDGHLFKTGDPISVDYTRDWALLTALVQKQQKQIEAVSSAGRSRVEENWQWLAIIMLALVVGFQQYQIIKIKITK